MLENQTRSWDDWKKIYSEAIADTPSDASDEVLKKIGRTQKARFAMGFIDEAIKRCQEQGLQPESAEAENQLEQAHQTAEDFIFSVNFAYSQADREQENYWDNDRIHNRGSMVLDVDQSVLISKAKQGNRLDLDLESFVEAIGNFLDRELRPSGVERVILSTLIGWEVSAYLKIMLWENILSKKSMLQEELETRIHPLTVFFRGRLTEALILSVIVIGLFVASSYGLFGEVVAIIGLVVLLALWTLWLLLTLSYLPTIMAQWRSSKPSKTPELIDAMTTVHQELRGSGPVSVSHLRELLSKAEELGASWPPSTYAILDDLKKRGIETIFEPFQPAWTSHEGPFPYR